MKHTVCACGVGEGRRFTEKQELGSREPSISPEWSFGKSDDFSSVGYVVTLSVDPTHVWRIGPMSNKHTYSVRVDPTHVWRIGWRLEMSRMKRVWTPRTCGELVQRILARYPVVVDPTHVWRIGG